MTAGNPVEGAGFRRSPTWGLWIALPAQALPRGLPTGAGRHPEYGMALDRDWLPGTNVQVILVYAGQSPGNVQFLPHLHAAF